MPDKLVIGTNPAGSLPHITAKLFVDLTNTGITVVPYSTGGTADAIRDILGGRVHAVIDGWASLRGGIEFELPHPACDFVAETVGSASDLPVAAAIVPGFTSISGRRSPCARGRRSRSCVPWATACARFSTIRSCRSDFRKPALSSSHSSATVDALHRGRAEVLAAARQEIRDLSRPSGNMVGGFALVAFPLGLQLSRPATATPGVAHPAAHLELPWARQ